jgi:serine/threonine protein kinase
VVKGRSKRIEDIFHAACELDSPGERERYLDEACESDTALRHEVEALLNAAPAGDKLFQQSEQKSLRTVESPLAAITEQPGSIIGRYKLLEKIGEGGMGVVYMAEQEHPVRRKVALKIIKLGMDTRSVVARFEAERQALAMMDHPHIAQVLDAGATEAGRPYFVMELVQGVPITQFCETNQLSVEERLELFVPVCEAIQSAHQKGIIHRDLKPSNVLVTLHNGAPHPMVIDFGVAKAIDQKLTEKTLFTNFATMIGTPAYMSPEQAEMSKLDVDTRSDIYSLGVLLYELLTSTTPFPEERLRSVAYGEMQRIIVEEEPERPSTRLKKRAIAGSVSPLVTRHSSLATDLDWIVMKCLEKDRNRRYETATGLAGDIEAHLNAEPVIARPPSTAYRFQKFVRRNRTASTAVALVTLAVLLGIIVSTSALVRERAARKQSDERLNATLLFVDDVLYKVAPDFTELPGAARAQEKLGQAGLDFLNRLETIAADDARVPLALARVFVKTSDMQNPGNGNSLGNFEAGVKHAEQAMALLAKPNLSASESERVYLQAWASFNRLQCLYALGRVDDAIASIAECDRFYAHLEQMPKEARAARRHRNSIANNAGYYLTLAGRPSEALQRFLVPLLESEWTRDVKGDYAKAEGYELETVMNVNANIASAYLFLHEAAAMLPHTEEATRVADYLLQRFPGSGRYARQRARCMAVSAYAIVRSGEIERGTALLSASREAIEALVSKDALNDQFRYQRAVTAAIQAMTFAALSNDTSTNVSDRRRHFEKAEAYLAEAEGFTRAAKTKEPEAYLKTARADVAAAKAKL